VSLDLARFQLAQIATISSPAVVISNMIPHNIHTSIPRPLWKCKFSGCVHAFKNRAGLKSHMRTVHLASPEPGQQHPPHTPNTRFNLQPLTVPLSPSFPPISPLSPSSSESDSDPDVSPPNSPSNSHDTEDDDENNDYDDENDDFAMHVDRSTSPSPIGSPHPSTSSSSADGRPEPVTRSYHPIINGTFFLIHFIKLNSKSIYQVNLATRMAIIFHQTRRRRLVMLSTALMTGLLIKIELNSNWQTSSIGVIRCPVAILTNCSACGQLL
jgi:hypothetical protein